MSLVFASLLLDVLTVMGVPGVSAAFFSAAGAACALLTGRTPAVAEEWAVRGLAAGFLFGLSLAVYVAIELAQAT